MPKRVIDGEAVWGSTKLKSIPEDLRLHYTNWLPLAEANGVFEANPAIICQRVYGFLLPSTTAKQVARVLREFIRVGLVHVWEAEGKVWGYFNGIHKAGRLPSDKHVAERYKNLPPDPPRDTTLGVEPTTKVVSGTVLDSPPWFGIGIGIGSGIGFGLGRRADPKKQNLKKLLPVLCRKLLSVRPEPLEWHKAELDELSQAYGSERVLDAFEAWALTRQGETLAKPIAEFVRVADGFISGTALADPAMDELCATLYTLGEQEFTGKNRAALGRLRSTYADEEIVAAYREFVEKKNDSERRYAAKNFAEGGAVAVLISRRREAERLAAANAALESTRERLESEAEQELAEVEARTAAEDATVEENL